MIYKKDGIAVAYTPAILMYSPFFVGEYSVLLERIHIAIVSFCMRESWYYSNTPTYELCLCSDIDIAPLVQKYFGVLAPTNVLAFEQEQYGIKKIILSLETTQREACLYGQKPEEYTEDLLIHACIHTHGFNHGLHMEILTSHCKDILSDVICEV